VNILNLKDIKDSDMIPPDDWNYHCWQILDDLGFKLDGSFKMSLDHKDDFEGIKKMMKMIVFKKKDGWYLEYIKNNNDIDGEPVKIEQIKKFSDLTEIIHDIFQKF